MESARHHLLTKELKELMGTRLRQFCVDVKFFLLVYFVVDGFVMIAMSQQ
jgi:hypothetical protein